MKRLPGIAAMFLLLLQGVHLNGQSLPANTEKFTRQGWNFVDQNGDGVCDRGGKGPFFTDANKDGICDHRNDRRAGLGEGRCQRHGGRYSFQKSAGRHHGWSTERPRNTESSQNPMVDPKR